MARTVERWVWVRIATARAGKAWKYAILIFAANQAIYMGRPDGSFPIFKDVLVNSIGKTCRCFQPVRVGSIAGQYVESRHAHQPFDPGYFNYPQK